MASSRSVNPRAVWLVAACVCFIGGAGRPDFRKSVADQNGNGTPHLSSGSSTRLPRITARVGDATLWIRGIGAGASLALRLRAGAQGILDVDTGDDGSVEFSFDRALFDRIVVTMGDDDDVVRIDEINGVFTDTELTTIDGGGGNDTLIGGFGAETLIGGPGDDLIDGNQGSDVVFLGDGDDVFQWDPGDGSDIIEGEGGYDTLLFNGSGASENISIGAHGARVQFFRDVGNILLDLDGVERIHFHALGGADTVTVSPLGGTACTEVNVDFANPAGSGTGDGQTDAVVINGTDNPESFVVTGNAGAAEITGLGALVRVATGEPLLDVVTISGLGGDSVAINGSAGNDQFLILPAGVIGVARVTCSAFTIPVDVRNVVQLAMNGLDGADSFSSVGNLAGLNIPLVYDGGDGADTILGSNGADVLIGGPGNDFIDGQQGNDVAFLGDGDDIFQWDPGDGSDTVEGQLGQDTLLFNGSAGSEIFDLSANGQRLRFTRNLGNIVMDVSGVELVELHALGSTDVIQVNDLAGTDVAEVNIDLAGTLGGVSGDAQIDHVIVNATGGTDFLTVSGSGTSTAVAGLSAVVNIIHAELSLDRLTVNALGGDDTVQATGLAAGVIGLTINGGPGDDNLTGSAGVDELNGNEDDDTVRGGAGNDVVNLGPGNDRFIWNPGDGSDIVEGDLDIDTVEVNGGNGDEEFTVTANGDRVRFDRLSPAPFFLDIGACENLVLNAQGGNDTVSCTGNLAALIAITIDGGDGSDTLRGSNGADVLIGGPGNDFIDGQQGNDIAFLGDGDDVFQWDPGDGSDTVEGQAGLDTLLFNGSAGSEIFDFAANGPRLRFTRNLGSIVMDVNGVERVNLQALGGTDMIVVNDLAGTDVAEINSNLAGTLGGLTGDAQIDNVIVNATIGDDDVTITNSFNGVLVAGLVPVVNVIAAELALDRLTVNGLGGDDTLQAIGLAAGVIGLTINGGPGNDTLVGSAGIDELNGNEDNDTVRGGGGNDLINLGPGNDRFQWIPGDGIAMVDGDLGIDTVEVNGGDDAEDFTITANGDRVRFDRISPAPFFLDIGTSENLLLNAQGGNDTVSCTGGLAALIAITIDGGDGSDTLRGSNGADVLIGGPGNDFIDGQQGNDIAFLGDGDDVFQWDPGDGSDIIEGQLGQDTLLFNGSAGSEIFDLSANGQRLRFTRNLGNIVMDVNGVELVNLNALNSTDNIIVNNLAGTSVLEVNVDLALTLGGVIGDSLADVVTVNGTDAPDAIHIAANAGAVEVTGLPALVRIFHSESAFDSLIVNGLGGADTFTTGPGVGSLIMLTTND